MNNYEQQQAQAHQINTLKILLQTVLCNQSNKFIDVLKFQIKMGVPISSAHPQEPIQESPIPSANTSQSKAISLKQAYTINDINQQLNANRIHILALSFKLIHHDIITAFVSTNSELLVNLTCDRNRLEATHRYMTQIAIDNSCDQPFLSVYSNQDISVNPSFSYTQIELNVSTSDENRLSVAVQNLASSIERLSTHRNSIDHGLCIMALWMLIKDDYIPILIN